MGDHEHVHIFYNHVESNLCDCPGESARMIGLDEQLFS